MKKSILFLLLILLTSCGARKTQKSKIEEEVKIESEVKITDKTTTENKSDLNINAQTKTETSTKNNVTTTTTTAKPIDNSKPASIVNNGKTIDITNAEVVIEEKTDLSDKKEQNDSKVNLNEKVAQTFKNDVKSDSKAKVEVKKVQAVKNTEREQYDFTKIIIVVVLIIMVLLWWYFGIGKKKKDEPHTT